jgi:hypothetical protein
VEILLRSLSSRKRATLIVAPCHKLCGKSPHILIRAKGAPDSPCALKWRLMNQPTGVAHSEGVKIAGGKGEPINYLRSGDYSITKFSDFSDVLELSKVTLI